MDLNALFEMAKLRLSPQRFAHVQGVAETAKDLARRYQLDEAKAEAAALLHDIYRELGVAELRELADEAGFELPEEAPATWHGPVAAKRLQRDFGIADPEIEEAMAWHTLGHPAMGPLAKVIYVADAIEPGRQYAGVEELRLAAAISLPLATAVVADASLRYLLEKQLVVSLTTVELRNKMWRLIDEPARKEYNHRRTNI